ncbi:hypothetical protein E6W39_37500 [Kitasatospora acidiphila]|uniref:Uncharacterized protein n=1 Tax=Kitasatospora acidiphila TaxID=2567942 RepID=A0A540WCT9_9ACTN|nr:hypothetical protein [Kitasatospora acidiphila]TQF06849.1 hypothetical protein E6W39_37500 [Kitasatospora acidiphila]
MTRPDLIRPHYRENQQLGVADLEAEQEYRITTRRRHDTTAHTAGVAHGLGLSTRHTGCQIAAGLAVDGLGRAVVLPDPVLLRWSDLPAGAAALDLFLGYREDVTAADRVTEGADVHVTQVQPGDDVAGPAGTVYLGRLVASTGPPYVPASSPVTWGTAEGAAVAAPTGGTMQLDHDPALTVTLPDPAGRPVPRLAVSPTTGTAVNGSVIAHGARLAPGGPLRFDPAVPAPKTASPWRWYRAAILADGVQTGQELRVEMGAPGPTEVPDWYRFAVGTAPDGALPLVVHAGGDTTVGSLDVEGTLIFGPLAVDPGDPRLAATLMSTWTGAVGQSSLAIDRQFSGDLFDNSALTVAAVVQDPNPPPQQQKSARKAAAAPVVPPQTLAYDVKVTSITSQAVTDLTVAAVITVNGVQKSERLGSSQLLQPDAEFEIPGSVPLPAADSVTVHVEVVALGLLPGGKVTLGVTSFDWRSVPPVPNPSASPRTGRFHWR